MWQTIKSDQYYTEVELLKTTKKSTLQITGNFDTQRCMIKYAYADLNSIPKEFHTRFFTLLVP